MDSDFKNTKPMKALLINFSIFLFFLNFSLNAQENPKIPIKDFKIEEKKGFNAAFRNLEMGNQYYETGVGTYDIALEHFLQARKYNDNFNALDYKIGVCYLYTRKNLDKAIKYLYQSIDGEKDFYDIKFLLGRAYHYNYQFDSAITYYQSFINSLQGEDAELNKEFIEKLISECKTAKIKTKKPARAEVKCLGRSINSPYDDFNPIFGDSVMYFTSKRQGTTMGNRNPIDFKFYEDIYYSQNTAGLWRRAVNIGRPVNSAVNDAAIAYFQDENKLFVYNDNNGGDIHYTTPKITGGWATPKSYLPNILNTKERESSITFTEDRETIYLVSKQDGSLGGKDIFVCHKNSSGKWSKPKNLGPNINTQYDEEGVFITPSEDTLFFSSQGHETMGGFDIFFVTKQKNGKWSKPKGLGHPINTPDNDIFFKKYGRRFYYSSVKKEGFGGLDIYVGIFYKPITWIKGMVVVKDSNDKFIPNATVEFLDKETGKVIGSSSTNENGKVEKIFEFESNIKEIGVQANAEGFMMYSDNIEITKEYHNDTLSKVFELEKIDVGKKVVLNNIYFEFDKSKLKESSFEELNRLVEFMNKYPSVKILISGHTDNIGSLNYNQRLSEARAKSVYKYLIEKEIEKDRLTYKGFAFNQPIATNETDEGRQQNRRVEFKIVNK